MNRQELETIIREILEEHAPTACPIKKVSLPQISITEADRLDTGKDIHKVYTHDVLTTAESPRLGAGIMEMQHTTFPWELHYDEIDYVIDGQLTIYCGKHSVTAQAGEMLYIPKDSSILFSVTDKARFLYVTYPADWQTAK